MTSPTQEAPDTYQALAGIGADYDPSALAEEKAKELSNPALFNFMKFLQDGGKSLPTEEVMVFSDLGAALDMQAAKIDNINIVAEADKTAKITFAAAMREYEAAALGTISDPEPPDKNDPKYAQYLPDKYFENVNKIEQLQDKLYESRILFQVKGIAPRVLQIIESNLAKYRDALVAKETPTEVINRLYDLRKVVLLTSSCVVSYKVPAIEYFSDKKLTPQEAHEILNSLHSNEQQKLVDACMILTYAVAIADPRTEAGFLSRRTEQAGAKAIPVGSESSGPVLAETELPSP